MKVQTVADDDFMTFLLLICVPTRQIPGGAKMFEKPMSGANLRALSTVNTAPMRI